MAIIIPLLGYSVTAYFLVAAFHPPLRMRWGVKRVIHWSPKESSRARLRLPKMGAISCLGVATFIGALITAMTFTTPDVVRITTPVCFIAVIVIAIGRTFAGNWKRY